MQILGVRFDNLEKEEILEKIENFLREDNPRTIYPENKARGKFHQIATVNPEFILAAQKDEEFKEVLNECDLNVADGFGLKFAFWRSGKKLKTRIAGIDLMREILKMASDKKLKVFLVANNRGLSTWEETREAILKTYPNLEIGGINIEKDLIKNNPNYQLLIANYQNYEVIFCSFGAPYQEKFLHSLKSANYDNIKIAMGVGGSFDFVTGKLRRAPFWMRKIGLEWLFRLTQQPRRFKRIFKATILFPITVLLKLK